MLVFLEYALLNPYNTHKPVYIQNLTANSIHSLTHSPTHIHNSNMSAQIPTPNICVSWRKAHLLPAPFPIHRDT